MSATTPQAPVRQSIKYLYLMILMITMGISGLLAFEAGGIRYTKTLYTDNVEARVSDAVERLHAGDKTVDVNEISIELGLLAKATSEKHMYDSKLPDLGVHYASMPTANVIAISVHVFFASFCMLVGVFQFIPAFRKGYPKLHRLFGAIYIFTVPINVVASLVYLLLIPPSKLYVGLTGYLALFAIGLIALGAVIMAVLALKKRQFAQHQGYMAFSFGMLLIAPMLRWIWISLYYLLPEGIDQETISLATLMCLVPTCILIAYSLVLINRGKEKKKPKSIPAIWNKKWQVLLWGLVACMVTSFIYYFGINSGLTGFNTPEGYITPVLMQKEYNVLNAIPALRWIFVVVASLAVIALGNVIQTAFSSTQDDISDTSYATWSFKTVVVLGAIMTGILMYWGTQISILPNKEILSGGGLYIATSVLLFIFYTRLALALYKNQLGYVKENALFLLSILPFCFFLCALLWLLQIFPWSAEYLALGQFYQVAAGTSLMAIIAPFFYVIYGQAMNERFIA